MSLQEREIDLSLGMQMWPDTDGSFDETQGEEGQGELYIDSRDLGFVCICLLQQTLDRILIDLVFLVSPCPRQRWSPLENQGSVHLQEPC